LGLGPTKFKNRRYPDGKTTGKNNKKRPRGKGVKANGADARIINASTVYETCTEQSSPISAIFFGIIGTEIMLL
jgi:hypothetical protein